MSVNLVLRPASSDIASADQLAEWQWLVLDRKGRPQGPSKIGQRPPSSEDALLLIPANWLHAQGLQLPAMRRAQLRQAVPFALEEQVAGDIEQLHVAYDQSNDGHITAVAIDPEVLQNLLQQLEALGIKVTRAIPDACCQTAANNELQVLKLGPDYVVSSGDDFLLLDADELEFLLSNQVPDPAEQLTLVWYARNRPAFDWPGQLRTQLNADPFTPLAARACQASLNILQDRFTPAASQGSARGWRLAAVLAGAVILLGMLYAGTDWWLLKRASERYQSQVQTVFRETFPQITNVVNPRVQAERALADINPANSDALLRLLGNSAPVLSAQPGLLLHSINYDRNGLRLEVEASSIAELDEFKEALEAQGLPVQIDSAARRGESVRGQIVIDGAGNG